MGVETGTAILIAGAVSSGSAAYFGKEQMDAAGAAREKADKLEAQRRKQLADQAAARQAAADRAATSGSRVGSRTELVSALGFGTGNTQAGLGAGTLTGGAATLFGN